jgi:hypothetical protein
MQEVSAEVLRAAGNGGEPGTNPGNPESDTAVLSSGPGHVKYDFRA